MPPLSPPSPSPQSPPHPSSPPSSPPSAPPSSASPSSPSKVTFGSSPSPPPRSLPSPLAPRPAISSKKFYVRPLSTYIHSHSPDPAAPDAASRQAAFSLQLQAEKAVQALPHNYQCWIVTALRRKFAYQEAFFRRWQRGAGLPSCPPVSQVLAILDKAALPLAEGAAARKRQLTLAPYTHGEDDLTVLDRFVAHVGGLHGPLSAADRKRGTRLAPPGSLFARLAALPSRGDKSAALHHLRARRVAACGVVLAQGRGAPDPAQEASYTLLTGAVSEVLVPDILLTSDSLAAVAEAMDGGARHPALPAQARTELLTGGDLREVPLFGTFGDTATAPPDAIPVCDR